MNLTKQPPYQKPSEESDKDFLEWISHQPSSLDGTFNQYEPNRNIACHVRRLSRGSSLGKKPSFSAVPMTDEQHKLQHSANGEALCLQKYKGMYLTPEEAAKWFENEADRQAYETRYDRTGMERAQGIPS